MKRLEAKHPRPVRWMHWINVPLLFGMIWSGLLIYWLHFRRSLIVLGEAICI
jgi:cytochrome b subunit of formate dehydrogenase